MYNALNTFVDILVVLYVFGILVYIYLNYKNKVLDFLFSLLLAVGFSEGIKFFVDKPRPILGVEGGSFPSTHTAIVFNAAFFVLIACHTLSKNQNREGKWFLVINWFGGMTKKYFIILIFLISFGVGALRVISKAHYIEDILFGIVIGLSMAIPFKYYDVSARRLK